MVIVRLHLSNSELRCVSRISLHSQLPISITKAAIRHRFLCVLRHVLPVTPLSGSLSTIKLSILCLKRSVRYGYVESYAWYLPCWDRGGAMPDRSTTPFSPDSADPPPSTTTPLRAAYPHTPTQILFFYTYIFLLYKKCGVKIHAPSSCVGNSQPVFSTDVPCVGNGGEGL